MASIVQICNLALLKFGDITITALTDSNREARSCKVLYPILRDKLLYSHAWNFAMERADISAELAAAPAFQWDYAYTLPDDCLMAWELYGTTAKWVVESGKLLTNQDSEIYLRYIRKVETSGLFNPAFVTCLATLLGAELAAKIKGDMKKRAALLEEFYRAELPNAYRLNAIEGNRELSEGEQGIDNGNYSWQTAGHSGDNLKDRVFST